MENAVLIGAITPTQLDLESAEYLTELKFLTHTAGGKVCKVFQQKITKINAKTFLGKGKILEIGEGTSEIQRLIIAREILKRF